MDNFVYDEKNPEDGRFFVSLLTGTMRALTGLVGKANPENVGFTTSTRHHRHPGTGLDLDCGSTAAAAASSPGWARLRSRPAVKQRCRCCSRARACSRAQPAFARSRRPTLESLPRPDTVPANTKELFGAAKTTPAPAAADKAADNKADSKSDNKAENKADNKSDAPTKTTPGAATPTAQPAPAAAPPSLADEPGLFRHRARWPCGGDLAQ